jgi:hypothetical protein
MCLTHNGQRGFLRAARHSSRPTHADQLHVDLWWNHCNLAVDAGTYSYNLAYPWDNRLSGTDVHNTVMIENQHQMTRAGKFLWLDWAQATIIKHTEDEIIAQHNGYRRHSIVHRRRLKKHPEGWEIEDFIIPAQIATNIRSSSIKSRLQWLVPDWEYDVAGSCLSLHSQHGRFIISVEMLEENHNRASIEKVSLIRAGHLLYGGPGSAKPYLGWHSPTYLVKRPALAFHVHFSGTPPYSFRTLWKTPCTSS